MDETLVKLGKVCEVDFVHPQLESRLDARGRAEAGRTRLVEARGRSLLPIGRGFSQCPQVTREGC